MTQNYQALEMHQNSAFERTAQLESRAGEQHLSLWSFLLDENVHNYQALEMHQNYTSFLFNMETVKLCLFDLRRQPSCSCNEALE